eukprot:CAMPEP_0204209518 /NCGR_PEP_ID=MMETSP0361-20130328/73263_1 /ASSEMBLY_ACC=CAM_ASM_000343 /TAXON_ID=268821 /ORGANISM="Scrippsiella Hangoei, Strain SHTV-5" /LENGTH=135 /DNA_ID=CAMNT_0051173489 /DNA_START=118 /DNA_END=521 /DNA_ORIENTATION=-
MAEAGKAVSEDPYAADLSLFDSFLGAGLAEIIGQDGGGGAFVGDALDEYLDGELALGLEGLGELAPSGYRLVLEAEGDDDDGATAAEEGVPGELDDAPGPERAAPPAPPMPALDEHEDEDEGAEPPEPPPPEAST